MLKSHLIFLLALLCFPLASAFGQVNADFTANQTAGCSPLSVIFTDQSTGPVTSWEWDFGNANTSTIQNPVATYSTPGTYTVTLIVSDGTNSDTTTFTNYIEVYQNPSAAFTATTATSGCAPLDVTFDDQSVLGGAPITSWIWDFGDGTIDNSGNPNPTHTYVSPGTFPVSLQVVDSNGCTSSFLINGYIGVSPSPVADFSTNVTSACQPPLTVDFTDQSSGSGLLSYSWDFGDGSTSTLQNPTHTYTTQGVFTVTLTVTDGNNCSTTYNANNLIGVQEPLASFTTPNPGYCVNEGIPFTNTSAGGILYNWDFGDGGSSFFASPTHSYSSPGTYDVTLIVSDPGGCADTIVDQIIVEEVVANFSNNPAYSCTQACVPVSYTDLSTNAVSWQWSFGNGATSAAQNPNITVCTGSYSDTLMVTSQFGCTDTYIGNNNIIVNPVETYIIPDEVSGCIPLTINFMDSTFSDSAIVAWDWDFGDGNTSSAATPSNTYTTDGTFQVTLIVTNSFGCVDTAYFNILAGTLPVAAIDWNGPDTVCWDEPFQFCSLAQPDSLINEIYWFPNNGLIYTDSCPDISGGPVNQFLEINFVAGYNGCYDTTFYSTDIYTLGPSAFPFATMDCMTPETWNFTGFISDATHFVWDFGDGSPLDSVNPDPVHTYGSTGMYTANLYAENDTNMCDLDIDIDIFVRNLVANFTMSDSIGCAPLTVNFNGVISLDEVVESEGGYAWDFGDGSAPDSTDSPMHTYNAPGVYNVTLVVLDFNGCRDTLVRQVVVTDPTAAFSVSSFNGCIPHNVTFTDQSMSDTTIVNWQWFFGDGTQAIVQNPNHSYNNIGTYSPFLVITDALGCVDTVFSPQPISVVNPVADFQAFSSTDICLGDSVWFIDFSSGNNLTYAWDFGDGTTSNVQNPWHTFVSAGNFSITLTVTDPTGCDSTLVRPVYVSVQDIPTADILASQMTFDCYPALVNFTDNSQGTGINQWFWDFGDNATSVIQNPGHNYTAPGSYDVSLVVTTANGCTDSVSLTAFIQIDGPVASFQATPDTICKGDEVTFFIDSLFQVDSYTWDFGDGAGEVGNGLTTTHTYNSTGVIVPSLIYSSQDGCTLAYTDTVYVYEVIADFIMSDSIGCVPLDIGFAEQTVGANTWDWDFGDGNSSTAENPQHTFTTPGTYDVTLIISSNLTGCMDTATHQVIVYLEPPLVVGGDQTICVGDSAQLFASGGENYVWTPGLTLNDDSIPSPLAGPDTLTQYVVTVVDSNGCVGVDSVLINVQGLFSFNAPNDTTLIIGEGMEVNLPFDPNLIYTWTPSDGLSCDDCPNPSIFTLTDQCYTVVVEDVFGCFRDEDQFCIIIDEQYSVDVPTAFTPNGDGVNDIIYVRGWGIQNLQEFKIFNRWGQLVFETTDINEGWDGFFRGELQNSETYVYTVVAELYSGQLVTKQGNLNLLR